MHIQHVNNLTWFFLIFEDIYHLWSWGIQDSRLVSPFRMGGKSWQTVFLKQLCFWPWFTVWQREHWKCSTYSYTSKNCHCSLLQIFNSLSRTFGEILSNLYKHYSTVWRGGLSVFQCYTRHISIIKLSGHSEQLNEQQKLRFSHLRSG